MIRIIGMLEIIIFYIAYFMKLFEQSKRGIRTNQLGKGSKPKRTVLIEKILNLSSITTVLIILASAIMDTSLIPIESIRWSGLLFIGVGTILFIIAMITMKDSWRAGIPEKDSTAMVTSGIYQYSRNPAFLGFDLTYIGTSLAFGNLILFSMAVITMIMMHLQILEEEKFLDITFGDDYLEYKKKVGRYFIFI